MLKRNISQIRVSIFARLFLVLFMTIIFFYWVSIKTNMIGIDNLKSETARTMTSQCQYFLSSFETEISRIINQQAQFINDDELQSLCYSFDSMTDYQIIQTIKNIQKRLMLLQNVSTYIDNAKIFIPSFNKTIKVNTIEGSIDSDQFSQIADFSSLGNEPIAYLNGRLLLNIPYPGLERGNIKKQPLYSLVIELSKKSITSDVTDFFNNANGGGGAMVGKSGGWVLGSSSSYSSWLKGNIEKVLDSEHKEYALSTTIIEGNPYFVVNNFSKNLNCILVAYVPQKNLLDSMMTYQKRIYFLSVMSVFMLAFYSIWMYKMFSKPVNKLLMAFGTVESGNLEIYIEHIRNDEFRHIYNKFNSMVQQLKHLIQQVYEEKIRSQQAELRQLQYQINPHFLYNSLYMIRRMAAVGDYKNITRFSQHLGSYYQYITRSNMKDVALYQEVEHMKNYIEIQTMRFGDRIAAECEDIPEECRNIKVPPLILQPIVENAYTHGFKDKPDRGHIWVRIRYNNEKIVIEVEDDGQGIGFEKLAEIQKELNDCEQLDDISGVANVNKRLRIRYGSSSGVTISERELQGCKVQLGISIKRGGSECTSF